MGGRHTTSTVLALNPVANSKRIGAEWDLRCTRYFSHLKLMAGVARFNGRPVLEVVPRSKRHHVRLLSG